MEGVIEKKEHWINNTRAIQCKDIFELAESLDQISKEHFVFATQVFKTEEGYDCLVHFKEQPKIRNSYNQNEKPTAKQLRFLKENKFKIDNNLTKDQATKKIKEFIDRKKQIKKERLYQDY